MRIHRDTFPFPEVSGEQQQKQTATASKATSIREPVVTPHRPIDFSKSPAWVQKIWRGERKSNDFIEPVHLEKKK